MELERLRLISHQCSHQTLSPFLVVIPALMPCRDAGSRRPENIPEGRTRRPWGRAGPQALPLVSCLNSNQGLLALKSLADILGLLRIISSPLGTQGKLGGGPGTDFGRWDVHGRHEGHVQARLGLPRSLSLPASGEKAQSM